MPESRSHQPELKSPLPCLWRRAPAERRTGYPPCPVDMKGELLLVDNGLITRLGDNVSEVEMEWRAASRQRQIAEIRVALGGDVNRIPAPLRRPSAPEDMRVAPGNYGHWLFASVRTPPLPVPGGGAAETFRGRCSERRGMLSWSRPRLSERVTRS